MSQESPVLSYRKRALVKKKELYKPVIKAIFKDLKLMITEKFENEYPEEWNINESKCKVSVIIRYDFPEDIHGALHRWEYLNIREVRENLQKMLIIYFGTEIFVQLTPFIDTGACTVEAEIYPFRKIKQHTTIKTFFKSLFSKKKLFHTK